MRLSRGSDADWLEVATITTDFRRPVSSRSFSQKFAHFTTAFADKCDDVDIGFRLARDHAEQRGFADAAAGENAQTLSTAAGHERIDRLNTWWKNFPDPLTLERVRR